MKSPITIDFVNSIIIVNAAYIRYQIPKVNRSSKTCFAIPQ